MQIERFMVLILDRKHLKVPIELLCNIGTYKGSLDFLLLGAIQGQLEKLSCRMLFSVAWDCGELPQGCLAVFAHVVLQLEVFYMLRR